MDLGSIRPRMEVVGSDGQRLGTVDHVHGDRIKLRRQDPAAGGQHHWIGHAMVAAVEGDTVRLTIPAEQASRSWVGEAAVQSPLPEGSAGMGDRATGTGGQSMAHSPETFGTIGGGEPGPRPDTPAPAAPSRDKDRDLRS